MRRYTKKALETNPSVRDGLSLELYEKMRMQCVQVMFTVVEQLKCPETVAGRASELFQKFFQRRTLKDNDRFVVAIACVYLASKIEGRHKHVKDVIYAACDVRYDSEENPLKDPNQRVEFMLDIKKLVLDAEEVLLLEILGFDFEGETPYGYATYLLTKLEIDDLPDEKHLHMHQLIWNLINDSMYTSLCLMFTGPEIARGLVELGSKLARFDLNGKSGLIWENVENYESIQREVSEQMKALYNLT